MKTINGLVSLEKRIRLYKADSFLSNLEKEKVLLIQKFPEKVSFINEIYSSVYDTVKSLGLTEDVIPKILRLEMNLNSTYFNVDITELNSYLKRFEPYPSEQKNILLDFLKVFRDSGYYPNGKKFFILQKNYFRAVFVSLEAVGYMVPPKWRECVEQNVDLLKVHGFNTNVKVFSEEHVTEYKKNHAEVITDIVKRVNKEKYIKNKRPKITIKNDTLESKPLIKPDEEVLD